MNEFEFEVKDQLFKDKLINFYNKNKSALILLFLFLIFVPILLQIYFFLQNKKKEKLFAQYLQAEILLETNDNNQTGIDILLNLQKKNNPTIGILSYHKLLEYYIENNKINKALDLLNKQGLKIKESFFQELQNIKKTIINFDKLREEEILDLLKINENDIFITVKKKILKDFYIKNNQLDKATKIK